MNKKLQEQIINTTGAESCFIKENIQELWSGYGNIYRVGLNNAAVDSIIVKHIQEKSTSNHPRGWNSSSSHQRKLFSYKVEFSWYRNWANMTNSKCYVPKCFGFSETKKESYLFLEDLDSIGFNQRKDKLNSDELMACVRWLAHFHATYLFEEQCDLWDKGTYWHLETRKDEFEAMQNIKLKNYAHQINQKLNTSQFKTFVHGDAKVANFCFNATKHEVAAVDFQYVGYGNGMQDLVYLMSSCMNASSCYENEENILQYYFNEIGAALTKSSKKIDFDKFEKECRMLYPIAWADFIRFLDGWSPNHWKINDYSLNKVEEAILLL